MFVVVVVVVVTEFTMPTEKWLFWCPTFLTNMYPPLLERVAHLFGSIQIQHCVSLLGLS